MASGGAQSYLARFEQQWFIANGAPPNGVQCGGAVLVGPGAVVEDVWGHCPPPHLQLHTATLLYPVLSAADLAALLLNPNSTRVSLNAERVSTAG